MLVTRDQSLYLRDMKSGKERKLFTAPGGEFVTYPVWSPDGKQFAFMLDTIFIGNTAANWGSNLYLVDAAGGCPKPLVVRQKPGEEIESPSWTADGKSIIYSYFYTEYDAQGQYKGQTYEARRLDVATGTVTSFLPNGNGTALCRDGSKLTYVDFDQTDFNSYGVWVSDPDGKNGKVIVDSSTNMQAFSAPQFSPDCKQIVFAAVGGGLRNIPIANTHNPIARLIDLFKPGVAEAHGPPWDLWVVNADGAGLTRITHVNEDLPYPQWSADGKTIMFLGTFGLYQVSPDGSNLKKIDQGAVHGQISWLQK
ncbi:MAG: TolB family protein [Dehalococcoidia bacterium]